MTPTFEITFSDLRARAESYGVRVRLDSLGFEVPGKFDGRSITVNRDYDPERRCYFLAHALGSIVEWGLDPQGCQGVFDDLHAARGDPKRDPGRLERAIERYRAFESCADDYGAWLLADTDHADVIPSYTNFARADLEALTRFHRQGVAPVWREFFAEWNRKVARGEQQVEPLRPRPVPPFRPAPMKTQEIIQEVDGQR